MKERGERQSDRDPLGPRGIRGSDQRANQAQEFLLLWPVTGREEKGSNLNIGDLAT